MTRAGLEPARRMSGERARRETFSSAAQIGAAERLADTLIVVFGQCEEAGRPLTDLQKIDILSSALLAFDGYRAELEGQLSFEQILRELAGNDGEANGERRRSRAAS